jgi:hypothetical protein
MQVCDNLSLGEGTTVNTTLRLCVLSLATTIAVQLTTTAAAQVLKPGDILDPAVLKQALNPLPGLNPANVFNQAQIAGPGQAGNLAAGHLVHGHVGSVRVGNGQAMLLVRFSGRQQQAAANLGMGMAKARSGQTYQLTPQTRIILHGGSQSVPASVAALRPGARISVQVVGQQAMVVQVYPRTHGTSRRVGYRTGRTRFPKSGAGVPTIAGVPNVNGIANGAAAPTAAAKAAQRAARQAVNQLRAKQVTARVKANRK